MALGLRLSRPSQPYSRGAMRTTNMDHDSLSNLLSSALRPSMQYKAPRRAREFLMFQPRCEPRVDYGGQAKVPRFKTRCKTHASCAEASRVCCMAFSMMEMGQIQMRCRCLCWNAHHANMAEFACVGCPVCASFLHVVREASYGPAIGCPPDRWRCFKHRELNDVDLINIRNMCQVCAALGFQKRSSCG